MAVIIPDLTGEKVNDRQVRDLVDQNKGCLWHNHNQKIYEVTVFCRSLDEIKLVQLSASIGHCSARWHSSKSWNRFNVFARQPRSGPQLLLRGITFSTPGNFIWLTRDVWQGAVNSSKCLQEKNKTTTTRNKQKQKYSYYFNIMSQHSYFGNGSICN